MFENGEETLGELWWLPNKKREEEKAEEDQKKRSKTRCSRATLEEMGRQKEICVRKGSRKKVRASPLADVTEFYMGRR